MRILSRYFLTNYLIYYAAILVVSMLVIAVIEMMVNFDHIIEYGEGWIGAASYLFVRLPSYYLPFLIPVGSYAAAFLCLGLPARSLEIVAAKTGGISPRRLAVPVLIAASLLSFVALAINETIVLQATSEFNQVKYGGDEAVFQARGSFWYHRGNSIFSVQEADAESRTLHGVTIYERDADGQLLKSVQAESAEIGNAGRWLLKRAVIRHFDPASVDSAPRTEVAEETSLALGSRSDLALLGADPRGLSLPRLTSYIEALASEGRDTTRYRAMLHSRLAEPVSVLVFALLGVPIGLAVERSRSLAAAALQGIAIMAGYYGLQTTSTLFGSGGVSAAVLSPWIVLFVFAGFGCWRFSRVDA